MELSEIYRPIQKELVLVDREFEKELQGYDGFSSTILEFLCGDQGKKLRPALVLMASRIGGQFSHDVIRLATAVELLHTATLIHDDVLDEALLRRKRPSLNFRWGNEVSVVIGDYIYAKAFIILADLKERGVYRALTETARVICMGELAQLERRYDFTLSEESYISMIDRKTASLIAAACELGSSLGGSDSETAERMARYGRQYGIGFQIIDDCLDLFGDEKSMGKSLRTDIRKGKPTLPLIYLLQEISKKERERLKEKVRQSQDGEAVEEIRTLIIRRGMQERAMARARSYLESAKEEAAQLSDGEVKGFLTCLADYTLSRNR